MCQCFERLKLKTSEFGMRKGLLMEKAPTEKMGDLILKFIFGKYRVEVSFMPREGEMGGARGDWPLHTWGGAGGSGASRGRRKVILVAVSLAMRFLQIFDKQYIVSLSSQAITRISLMINISICKTEQKLLAWRPWEQSRLEQDGVGETEHFTVPLLSSTKTLMSGYIWETTIWTRLSPSLLLKIDCKAR